MKYFTLTLCLLLSACEIPEPPAPTAKQIQTQKAAQAASQIHFDENAEIENIKRRLELTSAPGLLGYVVLLNDSGQPILYTTVKGKITSGSKRLTASQELRRLDAGQSWAWEVVDAPSDEGTFGSSNPYIYFWTTSGQYIQWSGQYLYSDKPIRLSVEPLVINVE